MVLRTLVVFAIERTKSYSCTGVRFPLKDNAVVSKLFNALDFIRALCAFRCSLGSISFANSLRASSRRSRASFSEMAGNTPKEIRFSFSAKRYFKRHHLPPLGETSRYRPPPSNSLFVFSEGLTFFIAVTVRAIWGQLFLESGTCPQCCPQLPPDVNRSFRT